MLLPWAYKHVPPFTFFNFGTQLHINALVIGLFGAAIHYTVSDSVRLLIFVPFLLLAGHKLQQLNHFKKLLRGYLGLLSYLSTNLLNC